MFPNYLCHFNGYVLKLLKAFFCVDQSLTVTAAKLKVNRLVLAFATQPKRASQNSGSTIGLSAVCGGSDKYGITNIDFAANGKTTISS